MPSQSSPHAKFARAPLLTVADLGIASSAITGRVKRGALHRVHRGVYSIVPPDALSRESRWLAALLAVGDDAALSHLTAAALRRLIRWSPDTIDVTVPRYRRSMDGVRIHECRRLDPRDVTTYRGFPVTTVARMLVELTDVQIAEELTNVIHEAAFRRSFSIPAAREAMRRANGRRNLGRLEEAIALWQAGSAGLKSRLEREFLRLVVEAGLPKPIPNLHVDGIEVDAYWPEARLVVEIDGPNHTRPPTLRGDGSRDRWLGCTVLRFNELDLELRPRDVVSAVAVHL